MAYVRYAAGASEGTTCTLDRGTSDTNRIAIFVWACEALTLPSSVTCSIGGQSCTAFSSPNPITQTDPNGVGLYAFWCNDDTLDLASSGDVTYTVTGGTSLWERVPMAFLFDGRSQSAPTFNAATVAGSASQTSVSASVSASASNADLLGVANDNGGAAVAYAGDLTDVPAQIYTYADDGGTYAARGTNLGSGTRTAIFNNFADASGKNAIAVLMEAAGGTTYAPSNTVRPRILTPFATARTQF